MKEFLKHEICDGKLSFYMFIKEIFFNNSKKVIFLLRLRNYFKDKNCKILFHLLNNKLIKDYGIYIGKNSNIEKGIKFPHPNSIVIGENVKIGVNAIIFQGVTIGGKNLGDNIKGHYPTIGDNVVIFAGAKVIGNIYVANNTIIGANSVVLTNTEKFSTYAGLPAKKIK